MDPNPYESPVQEPSHRQVRKHLWHYLFVYGLTSTVCGAMFFGVLASITFIPEEEDSITIVDVLFATAAAMITAGLLAVAVGGTGMWFARLYRS